MAYLLAPPTFSDRNLSPSQSSANQRLRLVEFLIQSAQQLDVAPIVKYSALSLFVDRFFVSLPSFIEADNSRIWLLQPLTESNLQLFVLMSIWISSKVGELTPYLLVRLQYWSYISGSSAKLVPYYWIHDSQPLSVRRLKSLADNTIKDQHFTTRDFLEAEVLLMQVLNFEIGTANITFLFLEELWIQINGVAKVGELINYKACMEIMDLLYEKEETSLLYSSPQSLAASILVASYVITVPKQKWEFPVLPWVKFVTSFSEEDIIKTVRDILKHILDPSFEQ